MKFKPTIWILLAAIFALIALVLFLYLPTQSKNGFNSTRAYQDVVAQVEFGPRVPGSSAHGATIDYIRNQLEPFGWEVAVQELTVAGQKARNVVAKRGSGSPWIILGAHYDSRLKADQDASPQNQVQPVLGANDGASGVAVLLELGRSIPKNTEKQIWLVFFDIEDQGNLPGWDWILGSSGFAAQLTQKPDAVVIVDMIGDADLNIYQERNSNPTLTAEIWDAAARNNFAQYFIPKPKHSMLDDHTPFLRLGIPAVDIIDFDYPYWHTLQDTVDKVSAESLFVVGTTLLAWLTEN